VEHEVGIRSEANDDVGAVPLNGIDRLVLDALGEKVFVDINRICIVDDHGCDRLAGRVPRETIDHALDIGQFYHDACILRGRVSVDLLH
jgi:hypothetical protein